MIWWLWTAFPSQHPEYVHVFDVLEGFNGEDDSGCAPDVAWLGECAWTALTDNAGLGLR